MRWLSSDELFKSFPPLSMAEFTFKSFSTPITLPCESLSVVTGTSSNLL